MRMLVLGVTIGAVLYLAVPHARADEWQAANADITSRCGSNAQCVQDELTAAKQLSIIAQNAKPDDGIFSAKLTACVMAYSMRFVTAGPDFYRFVYTCVK